MSNLFKSGFGNIKQVSTDPFIIDSDRNPAGRIIRPLEEREEEEPLVPANEELLDDAMNKANDILSESRAKANSIIDSAMAEAESIREKAYSEGYNQGLSEGNMEAMKRSDAYLEKIEEEKSVFMENYDREMEEKLASASDKLIELCCRIIEKMTGILVDEYKPVMLHMINNSLSEQDSSHKFTIKVAEELYPYISDNYDRLVGAMNPSITLEIFGDPKLDKRQCLIESDNGIIDLSMDVQVNNLITAFKMLERE